MTEPLVFNKSCTDKEGEERVTEEGEKRERRAEGVREEWEEKVEEKEKGGCVGEVLSNDAHELGQGSFAVPAAGFPTRSGLPGDLWGRGGGRFVVGGLPPPQGPLGRRPRDCHRSPGMTQAGTMRSQREPRGSAKAAALLFCRPGPRGLPSSLLGPTPGALPPVWCNLSETQESR